MARVLIVEDTEQDVRLLMCLMQQAGVHAQVFSHPQLAVDALEKAADAHEPKPDLIILDLLLGMDSGFEVLRFNKSRPELMDIPVIVWTGTGGKVEEQICRFLGVKHFVMKKDGTAALKRALDPILDAPAV